MLKIPVGNVLHSVFGGGDMHGTKEGLHRIEIVPGGFTLIFPVDDFINGDASF